MKNKHESIQILSENPSNQTSEILFKDSGIKMTLPIELLKRKIENGFYQLVKGKFSKA